MKWKERVAAALALGRFTIDDKHDAGSWASCAVSEMRPDDPGKIGESGYWRPTDLVLMKLGMEFTNAVQNDCPPHALDAYERIETHCQKGGRP